MGIETVVAPRIEGDGGITGDDIGACEPGGGIGAIEGARG